MRDSSAPSETAASPISPERSPERSGERSEEIRLAGNSPLLLDRGRELYVVQEGTVEVFAVSLAGFGSRMHLCTVPAGEVLCGSAPPPDGSGLGLLAVGPSGTRLLRIPAAGLGGMAGTPDAAADLAARLDRWLLRLFRELPHAAAPKAYEELSPGEETLLEEAGRAARPREGVAWVRHLEGTSHLLGDPRLAVGGSGPVPVPETSWLVSAGRVRLSSLATGDLLLDERLWQGIGQILKLFLAWAAMQREGLDQQERERLARKVTLDRSALGGAYARLASVLQPVTGEAAAGFSEAVHPLVGACRLVGQRQGIEIRTPPELVASAVQGDLLLQICAASRIRSRRVLLRGDWWHRDNGPLVGFRFLDAEQKQRRAVALLPVSARSYEMVDPADGTRTPVDQAVAEGLSGDAHMFYPPLPERRVTWQDLARRALAGRRRDLVTILLVGLGGGLLALLLPILTGQAFGNVIPSADRSQLLQITLALIVGALASAAFQVTRSIAVLRLSGKADGLLQSAVWDRLLSLPVSFFRRYTVGDLANRSLGINAIRDLLTGNVLTVLLGAVFSVFSFALLFYYSWRLALVATALVFLLTGTTALLVYLQLRHQRALLDVQGKIASMLFGMIGGIGKLRVAGAEARAFARWAERFAEQRQRTYSAQRVANAQAAFNAVYSVLTSLAIFAVVGFSSQESLPLGEFLAFSAAFGQFQASALSLVGVFSGLLYAVPVFERLRPILEELPEVDESKAEPGELAGGIEFSHVSFRYQADGPLILDDVSFRADPGEFVALVGPSGAGKSSCLRLILGFDKPESGSIYFDGQDLAGLAVQSVRRQIGVVLQTGRPMAGSIFSNIVGSSNLAIDDAWEAARMVGLDEDIKAMPMGMHTVISEGAETFSGGQKQRILIARAIVHRPRIVLFDEATSALDNRTQQIVSASVARLKATRIVIAHRLSTIQNADRIYVLEAGRVIEDGTYQDLVRRGGAFARLAARQIA